MAVHPRSRGEHGGRKTTGHADRGSSPLARGTRPGRSRVSARSTVHPRSRGEHCHSSSPAGRIIGSSPLARGTRSRPSPWPHTTRFIPARAGNTCVRVTPAPPDPVHPRSRGEHSASRAGMASPIGSSPLARGTPVCDRKRRRGDRFIPARAGNTIAPIVCPLHAAVHPRSRGEHMPVQGLDVAGIGSSPLARGTRCQHRTEHGEPRFIPARAGNTPARPRPRRRPAVHPRSRGEHARYRAEDGSTIGSSPLARGTRPPRRPPRQQASVHPRSRGEHRRSSTSVRASLGSSPLARGTRGVPPGCLLRDRFIPRSRGEHWKERGPHISPAGSSPLARGTPPPTPGSPGPGRFIPARAGNTRSAAPRTPVRSVHPRSRGEHARGPLLGAGTGRFIPARAGNTSWACCRSARSAVHPRSRGEHSDALPPSTLRNGSSPLARGTPASVVAVGHDYRFIPARAGNTSCAR